MCAARARAAASAHCCLHADWVHCCGLGPLCRRPSLPATKGANVSLSGKLVKYHSDLKRASQNSWGMRVSATRVVALELSPILPRLPRAFVPGNKVGGGVRPEREGSAPLLRDGRSDRQQGQRLSQALAWGLQAVVFGRYASLTKFIVTGFGPIRPLVGTATVRR